MPSPFRMPTVPPDEGVLTSLWRDAFDGDLQAREEFCHLLRPLPCKWARRWLKSREDAEDIAQIVCLKLLGARFDPRRGRFYPFAHKITEHECLALLRRRRPTVALEDVAVADSRADPAEIAAARDDVERLGQLLADLPDDERHVLQLRYSESRTLREVAGALDMPPGSVLRRVGQALNALRLRWQQRNAA